MAKKVSLKGLPLEIKYEPGFQLRFGVTDETTDSKYGTMIRTCFPPNSKSRSHIHESADMAWYCLSGKAIWLIGKEKKEYVTEAGDFFFVPRGEVHSTINPSQTEPVEGVSSYFGCSNPYKTGKKEITIE